ncbi:MAG TPA: hypothetical protein VG125_13790 [Pirellulales bacterium]|jgi:hypothetical protein|nr:hypothetical protein [Pirellulales bacterium]
MWIRVAIAVGILTFVGAIAQGQPAPPSLEPYPLPSKAKEALCELAGESDILILGEIHGTQEVPALAAALLQPLTEQGYGVLALEIPSDEQKPLTDLATGKTETVPTFFAKPWDDGRGNVQALALIRTALSPPFKWRLICFDESSAAGNDAAAIDDPIADALARDAKMASNLAAERSRLAPESKVLVICGNFHARTTLPVLTQNKLDKQDDDAFSKLWPSFAAGLRRNLAGQRINSVNVVPHDGGHFGTTSSDDGKTFSVGVQPIRAAQKIEEAEAHPLDKQWWDWELNLPRATPATFLAPPIDPFAAER